MPKGADEDGEERMQRAWKSPVRLIPMETLTVVLDPEHGTNVLPEFRGQRWTQARSRSLKRRSCPAWCPPPRQLSWPLQAFPAPPSSQGPSQEQPWLLHTATQGALPRPSFASRRGAGSPPRTAWLVTGATRMRSQSAGHLLGLVSSVEEWGLDVPTLAVHGTLPLQAGASRPASPSLRGVLG